MNYKDPLVLILNITVIVVLILLILPTLLNKKEKIGIRISFSVIFLIVIVNCIGNLMIFYFENYRLFWLHFALMSVPFLFGPAIFFYIKEINGSKIKNLVPHLIIPGITFIIGILYNFLPQEEKIVIINEMSVGLYLPYNLVNTIVIIVPLYYFAKSKIWLKKLKLDSQDNFYAQKKIQKNWANEFLNYMIFSLFSFLIIVIIATYILHIPQMYLDLIGMPIYFPVIYSIVAVRSNMISKDLEMQYVLSKSESEVKLNEQRTNISRDLHDNIGAYANSLISKIDYISTSEKNYNTEQINDLKENAENILSLLRQTIWVLNNDEIALESSFDYIKQYALKIFKNTNIKVSFEENIGENKILTSSQASNIFRIIQESCQNIMKHSKANKVKISIFSMNHFRICVEDNGVGFVEKKCADCYGLKNMEERAKNIGIILKIESIIDQGTKITMEEPFL
jgi:signal transduction histidine kinase